MDVERLMKDLTVEQLENIHHNLQTEMEGKREELRDMVGRRYRDVLEASSEVRQVRALAESLATTVGQARATHSVLDSRPIPRGHQGIVQRFIALHHLLPLIGDENGDGLSDAFALLLAENIHRQLVSENISPLMQGVVTGLTQRIVRTRHSLVDDLNTELGELAHPDWVSNQLIAISMLQEADLTSLLDGYLASRKSHIESLVETSISVLSLVNEVKSTLHVVFQLFVQGELNRSLQAIASVGYRPKTIESMIGDQAFSFGKMMGTEIEKINKAQRERKMGQLLTQKIIDKCTVWMEEVCAGSHEYVSSICSCYENPADIIEFLNALNAVLKDEWPRVCANTLLYQQLFGVVIIDRFKSLIGSDIRGLESKLLSQLPAVSSAPLPLFEKRTGKFDPLLGVGISSALRDCVGSFFDGVQRVRDSCAKYEKLAMDAQLQGIRDAVADDFSHIIERLSEFNRGAPDANACLSRARLCLALLQADANTVCLTLNKDGNRISRINKTLHKAVEEALSKFCCLLTADCLSESALREVTESTSNPLQALGIATEWEKVQHAEVGTVEVPVCLSPAVHSALFTLCRRLGDSSVAHLLSRAVRKTTANEIGDSLATVLEASVSHANASQRTWIQLLFDCRLLATMFPHERLRKLQTVIEGHIDPFDLTLLNDLLSTNVRLAAHRSQLLYSCLVVDILPNKDLKTAPSYSQVIDVVPRNEHPQRLALIPRLDRNPTEEASKRLQAAKAPKNKLLANPAGAKNPSLSSFYDKMSSSFSFFST